MTELSVANKKNQVSKVVFETADLEIDPLNLLCMNIPAYMGGVTDMWNNSKIKAPYKDYGESTQYKEYPLKQSIDDGSIEFLSFDSKIGFELLERINGGWGKRMCQGKYKNLSFLIV